MDKDIVPALLELIENEFDSKTYNSDVLKKAIQALNDKKATYKDANAFAIEVGEILAEVLGKNITAEILPDGKMYFNIADRIINPTMLKNHELISSYAADVQTTLNQNAGIKIKGQKSRINQSRIDGIVERVSNEEDFNKIKWILDEPIKNFSQAIVDDTVKVNMDFHAKTGLRPKITRHVVGGCCDWCREIAGTYNYGDEPEDIYRRHRYCRCRVEYDPKDGRGIQDAHTKEWRDPEKYDNIETRKKINKPTEYVFADKDEEIKLQAQSDKWYQGLDKDETGAILAYTGPNYMEINKNLREGLDLGGHEKTVNDLDSALKKFKTEKDYKFYRGVGEEELKFLERSSLIKDYTSLTTSESTGDVFVKLNKTGEKVIFNVKKGVNGAFIGSNSKHKKEKEFLVGRNARITSKRVDGVLEVTIHEN